MLDPVLFNDARVPPEKFSSPVLGRVFALLKRRHDQGASLQLGALAGELTDDEMSHLTAILNQPEDLSNGQRAMADYIQTIETEAVSREKPRSGDALLELRARQREKTMEDGR